MNVKSIALASIATLSFVAPAFAGSGASVTNSDTYRNIYNGKSVTKGIIRSAKVEVKRGTSAAIKLEGEGAKIDTNSYRYNNNYSNVDRDSDSYRNYSCSYWYGCRTSSYGYSNSYDTFYSNSNGSSTNTLSQSGGNIGVGAGQGRTAGVSGYANGSTVIGAVSESSFSSVEVTKSLIGFKDSYQYNGYDRTHTVSTEAF